MTLFLDFPNSHLPLKNTPFLAKMGTSTVYALVGSGGRAVMQAALLALCEGNQPTNDESPTQRVQ